MTQWYCSVHKTDKKRLRKKKTLTNPQLINLVAAHADALIIFPHYYHWHSVHSPTICPSACLLQLFYYHPDPRFPHPHHFPRPTALIATLLPHCCSYYWKRPYLYSRQRLPILTSPEFFSCRVSILPHSSSI